MVSEKVPLFIRRLMPNASQEELLEAAANWQAYMAVVRRLTERLRKEGRFDKHLEEIRLEKERWRLSFLEVLIGVLKQVAAIKEAQESRSRKC